MKKKRRKSHNSRSSVRYRDATIATAEFVTQEPSFVNGQLYGSAAQRNGIRYERKVHKTLSRLTYGSYVPSPWFRYTTQAGRWKYCQPDGLIFDYNRSLITVVEIKLGHALRAHAQIRNLYEPVVRFVFGQQWQYAACEVTSHYDHAVVFPEPLHFISRFSDLEPGQFGIFVLRQQDVR